MATNNQNLAVMNPKANKDRLTLVVDETPFVVDAKLFQAHQNTLLGRMFGNKNFELKANSRGEYDIGRGTCISSAVFRLILVSSTTLLYFVNPMISNIFITKRTITNMGWSNVRPQCRYSNYERHATTWWFLSMPRLSNVKTWVCAIFKSFYLMLKI